MEKILLLGGAYAQIPFIQAAKKRGLYVITCDYLPDNPGHKFADEYFNISTTDKEKVLSLAKEVKPDYIYAYASDPAIPIATYVAEQLGIGINPYRSVEVFSEKDLFREFLQKNHFNCPQHISIKENDNYIDLLRNLKFPFIVKPTDSSGSKGVVKVNNKTEILKGIEYALNYSRNKRLIAEEFIESNGQQFHGDGFVVNGELVFHCIGDHHYNQKVNPFVPFSTSWPTSKDSGELNKVVNEVSKLVKISGYVNGPINIEARVDLQGNIYIMEVGFRSGGNFVPQIIRNATGFDMVEATLDGLMKKSTTIPHCYRIDFCSYFVVHSIKDGFLEEVRIDDCLSNLIIEYHQYIKKGDVVKSFQGSNAAIGLLLLKFNSLEEQQKFYSNFEEFIKVEVS